MSQPQLPGSSYKYVPEHRHETIPLLSKPEVTSANPNKRPREHPASLDATRPAKQPRRGLRVHRDDRPELPIFETTVKMSPAFSGFPSDLRQRLALEYKTTMDSYMLALENGRKLAPNYNFFVLRGECDSREQANFNLLTHVKSFSTMSFANMFLLRQFMQENPIPLRPQKFVELKTQPGIKNEQFVLMHSVRPGEVGWGFDTHRCLSLYTAEIEEGLLRKKVFYVERQAIKQEPREVVDLD